jgi:hypothetical protein
MRKKNSWIIVLVFCCLVGGQEQASNGKMSKASLAASEAQTKRVLREIRHLGSHDWAGEYQYGDGLGVNVKLTLAPENGFVFTWTGCLGLYDLNYGDVEFTQGTVKLLFKYPNEREGFEGIAPEFIPVHWGQRHYLIPTDGMLQFTNAINAGMEPNSLFGGKSASFLLRTGDEKKVVSGMLDLASEYLIYILAEPLTTRISSITQSRIVKSRRITRVTINVGSADGLRKGMELFVKNPSGIYAEADVTDVSDYWASAVIEQDQTSDPEPSSGWTFSTKL